MKRYEKVLYIIIGIFAIVVLFWNGLVHMVLPPNSSFVIYNWQIKDASGHVYYRDKENMSSKVLKGYTSSGVFTYTATIDAMLFTREKPIALVISHPSFQAFDVYVDGVLIGSVGDMQHGNSNIWNGIFYFPIDKQFLSDRVITITIKGYALYIHGFDISPFIDTVSNVKRYVFVGNLVTNRIYNWAIGASLTVAISLFVLILLSGGVSNKKYYYFAFASLFSAIFYLDYTVILNLPVSYLIYKKLIIISAIMATYFIHNGILATLYDERSNVPMFGNILSWALVIVGILDLILGYNMVSFKKLYTYLDFIIPVVFIYDTSLLAKEYVKRGSNVSREIEILLIGMVTNSFFVVIDIFQLFRELYTSSYTLLVSTYGLMLFILVMNFALIYDYIDVYRKAMVQQKEMSHLRDISIKDPLTEAYNRKHLTDVLKSLAGDVCFLMLDIDHFKKVNDTYGHDVGDKVLKHTVGVIGVQIRSHDVIVRYGGEEFLIILTSCDTATGKLVAERIRKAVKNSVIITRGHEIRITVSVGVCCVEVRDDMSVDDIWTYIIKADEYLYIAKRSGRNKVVAGDCPAT